jgi:hypothetical protein
MPLEPDVQPRFASAARILNGQHLRNQVEADYGAIAELAGCHVNTVGPALNGRAKQYRIAHNIFTALNIISNNYFPREDHVVIVANGDDYRDPLLASTYVFPRSKVLSRKYGLSEDAIASQGDLHPFHVHGILESKRPTARNLVIRVFEVIEHYAVVNGDLLNRNDELIR